MIDAARIAAVLERRPGPGRLREQLFWLVDLIYACKQSGDPALAQTAKLVEDALGQLGEYLETGDTQALQEASRRVDDFAAAVKKAVKQGEPSGL